MTLVHKRASLHLIMRKNLTIEIYDKNFKFNMAGANAKLNTYDETVRYPKGNVLDRANNRVLLTDNIIIDVIALNLVNGQSVVFSLNQT